MGHESLSQFGGPRDTSNGIHPSCCTCRLCFKMMEDAKKKKRQGVPKASKAATSSSQNAKSSESKESSFQTVGEILTPLKTPGDIARMARLIEATRCWQEGRRSVFGVKVLTGVVSCTQVLQEPRPKRPLFPLPLLGEGVLDAQETAFAHAVRRLGWVRESAEEQSAGAAANRGWWCALLLCVCVCVWLVGVSHWVLVVLLQQRKWQ